MSDEEIVAELYRIAHTWDNHPIHSDMANTLRLAAFMLNNLLASNADSRHPGPHPQSTGFCQYED